MELPTILSENYHNNILAQQDQQDSGYMLFQFSFFLYDFLLFPEGNTIKNVIV